jgi:chromate reductase
MIGIKINGKFDLNLLSFHFHTVNQEILMLKWLLFLSLVCTSLLSAETKVLVFSGSLRQDSFNKKLAREAANMARQSGAAVMVIDLRDYPMPFYDEDLEAQRGMPENAKQLRKFMKESNAIIIASPEYNGSVSGVLKNAIDWASRNEQGQPSRDAFKDKQFAIISASPGGGGGSRGLKHLRSIIQNIGGEVVALEVSVPDAFDAFTPQGNLKSPQLRDQLKQEVQQLLSGINTANK